MSLSSNGMMSQPTKTDKLIDISAELELSQNISATIHQEYNTEKQLLAQMSLFPYNQKVFNKFALVRRSSTPVEPTSSLKRKFDEYSQGN